MGIKKRIITAYYKNRIRNKILINNYFKENKTIKLHLGCGITPFKSWLNIDLIEQKNIVNLDLRKKLPFKKNTVDYIFSEHLIEHLDLNEGKNLLIECNRILKPGGRIRIGTPDLKVLIDLFNEPKKEDQLKYIKWVNEFYQGSPEMEEDTHVINRLFYSWGHKFIYDRKILIRSLQQSGFIKITEYKPMKSNDKNLQNIESHQKIIGDFANNFETFILEAEKPKVSDKR